MTVTGSALRPSPAPRSADEERRLAAVDRYQILDTPPDGTFDKGAALAARIFRTPAAAITTADGYHLGTVNVLELDTHPRQVTAEQLAALQNLAALVMDQLEMRLSAIRTVTAERQMRTAAERLARTLQRTLLPPALPQVPGLRAAAYHAASADEVGGDFYDLFPLDDDRWAFFLGDVCGRGAEAAALTSLTRYTLRAAAIYGPDPCAVLANLDTVLKGEYPGTDPRHCTAVFGVLGRTEDGSFTLTLAGGGHPPASAVRADGTIQPLPVTGGQLIGLLPEPRFTQTSTHLAPGDALLLYTDGLTEARTPSGPMRQEEGLAAHLAAGTWDDADDLVAGIRRLLDHLGTGVNDDTALLALSVPIHPPAPAQETR
ncbi:PP2C family protein-serine/threonine phosphatase [Streptomyces microflavus]